MRTRKNVVVEVGSRIHCHVGFNTPIQSQTGSLAGLFWRQGPRAQYKSNVLAGNEMYYPPARRTHPYAEPHRAGAQVVMDRQDANGAPDLSGTPEKKGVRSCENHDVRPTIVRGS